MVSLKEWKNEFVRWQQLWEEWNDRNSSDEVEEAGSASIERGDGSGVPGAPPTANRPKAGGIVSRARFVAEAGPDRSGARVVEGTSPGGLEAGAGLGEPEAQPPANRPVSGSGISGAEASSDRSQASTAARAGPDEPEAEAPSGFGGIEGTDGYFTLDPATRTTQGDSEASAGQGGGARTKQRKPRRSRKVSARNQKANVLSRKKRNTKSRN